MRYKTRIITQGLVVPAEPGGGTGLGGGTDWCGGGQDG